MKILFFGVLADVCGVTEELVNQVTNLETLENEFLAKYPLLRNYSYQLVVNAQKTNGNIDLNLTDEVAFLPPFAGG